MLRDSLHNMLPIFVKDCVSALVLLERKRFKRGLMEIEVRVEGGRRVRALVECERLIAVIAVEHRQTAVSVFLELRFDRALNENGDANEAKRASRKFGER
jgi:hypothetical protein